MTNAENFDKYMEIGPYILTIDTHENFSTEGTAGIAVQIVRNWDMERTHMLLTVPVIDLKTTGELVVYGEDTAETKEITKTIQIEINKYISEIEVQGNTKYVFI